MNAPQDFPDFKKIEKNLVAEQPGLVIGVVGLFLSMFMGLALRTAFSPEKVLEMVDKAASKIDSRFTAKVGQASISLADGWIPEIAVVVSDFTLESEELCWMRPSLEVDQIKLPLDLFKFFTGSIHIHEVIANDVNLSLRSELSKCQSQSISTIKSLPTSEDKDSVLMARFPAASADWDKLPHTRNSIDILKMNSFKVHYLPISFTTFEIKNLEVHLKSQSPKIIKAEGVLKLSGETLSGDYSSSALLKLDYDESKKSIWSASVEGNWREGNYQMVIGYQPDSQDFKMDVDMSHIPLNQLFPMLRKYRILSSNFNGKQVWLTFKGGVAGKANKLDDVPGSISVLKVEGDIGDIEARNIEIKKIRPFQFKNIEVDIKSLKLDSLFTFLNRPPPSPSLGHWEFFMERLCSKMIRRSLLKVNTRDWNLFFLVEDFVRFSPSVLYQVKLFLIIILGILKLIN